MHVPIGYERYVLLVIVSPPPPRLPGYHGTLGCSRAPEVPRGAQWLGLSIFSDRFIDVYNELKYLGLEKSPFVIVSVVGQEVLNAGHTVDAINILECALRIGTTSLKLRQSVLSALSTAYYNIGDWTKAKQFMEEDLSIAVSLGKEPCFLGVWV